MTEHYFSAEPAVPAAPGTAVLRLPDLELELATDAGVFSHGHVDPGTLVLLREAPPPPAAGDLLDLGCGYGPIALTLAARAPAARVWAVDVNRRALELCRENAAAARLANVVTAEPEAVPADVRFAAIYSNPPVRIGRDPLRELLTGWLSRLAPGTAAHLVVQRHLGSDSLAAWLAGQGWAVERLASKRAYRVLGVRPGGD